MRSLSCCTSITARLSLETECVYVVQIPLACPLLKHLSCDRPFCFPSLVWPGVGQLAQTAVIDAASNKWRSV